MRIVSWNVNGRIGGGCEQQLKKALERGPDVLALQEITLATYSGWCDGLLTEGYSIISTIDLVRLPYPEVDPSIRRKYFNVMATRGHIAALPGLTFSDPEQARFAFPEKYVAARILFQGMEVDFHNAHLPPGSTRGEIKVQAFRAIRERIDASPNRPRILCGDFNTPQMEDTATVTTWASAHPGIRDWDAAERGVLEHPTMRDVYREIHQPGDCFPVSHFTRGVPRRYDHIYASPELRAVRCHYMMDWLAEGLSDHAAVEAELEFDS